MLIWILQLIVNHSNNITLNPMIKQETVRFKKKYFFQMASSGMSCIYNNGYIQLK